MYAGDKCMCMDNNSMYDYKHLRESQFDMIVYGYVHEFSYANLQQHLYGTSGNGNVVAINIVPFTL